MTDSARKRSMHKSVLALSVPTLVGCANLLPDAKLATQGPWSSFDEARQAIDWVVPSVTTIDHLTAAGINPYVAPSITILTYSDLLQRFAVGSGVTSDQLERGIRDCFKAGKACRGYAIAIRHTERKRVGSFWLDTFNFKRETDVTGWSFNALIVLVDSTVVYTLSGGQPKVSEHELTHNRLGPLQGVGEAIGGRVIR